MAKGFSRRRFIAASALASTALTTESMAAVAPSPALAEDAGSPAKKHSSGTWCHWLDDRAPTVATGATWGMPWERGKHSPNTHFSLRDQSGRNLPVQSWPLAYWPDGSLKWTAHAIPPGIESTSASLEVVPRQAASAPASPLTVKQGSSFIQIDTGVMVCRLPRSGSEVISAIERAGRPVLRAARLVALRQDGAGSLDGCDSVIKQEAFESSIERIAVENEGPVRAVVKVTGRHAHCNGRQWLPFTLRFYFYAGSDSVRVLHTFVFDGDEARDFIRGIGLRFDVPMTDPLHDRHVRFAGENDGVFGEAVRGLTGFAEAMTRHTGEVDVHHLGRFAPLGSRHNVMHWGCSAKQLRISTALNRRYYYFLTGDERLGDLLHEQVEAARTLRAIEPGRKLADARGRAPESAAGDYARLGFGTDWGSIAGAWLTEWERTRNPVMRDRLAASMRSIAAQPKGFFTGEGRMNLRSGAFEIAKDAKVSVSHLSAAFGLPEVCAELIELLAIPEFEAAWVQYCVLYNAPAEQQRAETGESFGVLNLQQGHSRLTAYAAHMRQDPQLARRAWDEFYAGVAGFAATQPFEAQRIAGSSTLNPVDEASWVSTNEAAQWGLAAIECLAFAADGLR